MFTFGVIGIIITVFRFINDPQRSSEKTDALMSQRMNWNAESTEKRFKDMQDNFNNLLLQSNNHIHTVDTKVDKVHEIIASMGKEITKLGTIIEERIPKK